jgi:hypothetical protein
MMTGTGAFVVSSVLYSSGHRAWTSEQDLAFGLEVSLFGAGWRTRTGPVRCVTWGHCKCPGQSDHGLRTCVMDCLHSVTQVHQVTRCTESFPRPGTWLVLGTQRCLRQSHGHRPRGVAGPEMQREWP